MTTKRVIIMRGVPGSGKSTAARWLAGRETDEGHQFWREDCVTYFGLPSLAFASAEWAKQGRSAESFPDDFYYHEPEILAAIHSTDEYFMVDGEYKFNASKIGRNHSKNYKAFRESVDAGIPLVIVDNTNTTRREWTKYQNYAESEGYWVSLHVMPHPTVAEAKARNTHNVPGDTIKKMIQRFE